MERIKLLIKFIEVNGTASISNPFIAAKTEEIPNSSIPILLAFLFLNKISRAPQIAKGTRTLSILNVINSVLKVVPIFVPSIIPIDCGNVIILAEINPIVITITAVLLCRSAVMNVPVSIPFSGVLVNLINQPFNLFADKLNRANLIMVIPKINNKMQRTNNSM